MADLFSSPAMAAGYAKARPKLHGQILNLALGDRQFQTAVDVGCGSGLSTRPLLNRAKVVIGIEPAERMLPWANAVAPGAQFVAAAAESLPLRDRSVDLVAAAGSLNYTDVPLAFLEIRRVLQRGGVGVIYDFTQGKELRDSGTLLDWYIDFKRRYPDPPPGSRTELDLEGARDFDLVLPMTAESYTAYAMTETNVALAIANGTEEAAIREWCHSTLAGVFGTGERDVVFRGYYACLEAS